MDQQSIQQCRLDAAGLPAGYDFRADWELTPRQVKAMLEGDDDLVLLDCRTEQEHRIARIAGSILIPLQKIVTCLPDLCQHADKKIVAHCHHGGRSLQAAAILRKQGFTDVHSMAGGINLWSLDIDPDVSRY